MTIKGGPPPSWPAPDGAGDPAAARLLHLCETEAIISHIFAPLLGLLAALRPKLALACVRRTAADEGELAQAQVILLPADQFSLSLSLSACPRA
eukprot:CAMPEP_0171488826 /NCGR_PEP_ID=MMETSP0958-20121227/2419_1 /TAXON_ID=87120 /ORGANISM="Aurantiochytrium limacinum, Strain ATCCMYA-1381" /LENGTH=93 /DNA_ID=CAMNT_0012021975 /DNA_START=879 /DNA_END=1161 /DNA_ORIENTATION=+